jgi:hypothetical protein
VWVTSGKHADSPRFSQMSFSDYVVRMPMNDMKVALENFVSLGAGSTHAVAAGQRWVYFSGRVPSGPFNPPLLRMVDTTSPHGGPDGGYRIATPMLEVDYRITEARGIALSSDEKLVFLAVRQPLGAMGNDQLLVATISDPMADNPLVSVVRSVPLPAEPLMVKVIPRPGQADVIAVACGFGFGSLVLYDDHRGARTVLDGIGTQAASIAVDVRPNGPATGARVYVSAFTDGRVAVVDVPDLNLVEGARVVAHLGLSQVCLTRRDIVCDGGVPP